MADETSAFKVADQDFEDLSELDAKALGRRWRMLVRGTTPPGLGRALILRILSYQLQAQRYGDLDRGSRQALDDILVRSAERTIVNGIDLKDRGRTDAVRAPQLRPGTVLCREYGGSLHRVVVMEQGFSWNGRTYDSLSKVAIAITGTRWNGPRFFGLRDRSNVGPMEDGRKQTGKKAGGRPVRKKAFTDVPAVSPRAASP